MSDHVIVLTTFPELEGAEDLAAELVKTKLAACVNILPMMTSVYQWKGKLETGQEHQLLIKTRRDRVLQIEAIINQRHPYELAELLVLSIEGGSKNFLNWITDTTNDE